MRHSIIKPTLVLVLVCVVVTSALAFTNSLTKDTIDERLRLEAENARKEVLSSANDFKALDGILDAVGKNESLMHVKEVFKAYSSGTPAGYVFFVLVKGYGGDMSLTVGINSEGEISGVSMGENNETPGLGSKANEEPFKSQLVNIRPEEKLKVVKANKSKPEEIDAISGATITSKAVVTGVQSALDMWNELKNREVE